MSEPYSLVRRAWIPVALSSGRRAIVRPCDISERHEDQSILRVATGRPDCDVSLTEFLIGLLAVTMGPAGHRDWLKRYRTPPTCAELETTFSLLEPAMILDGDGPRFFQDRDELDGEVGSIEALFIDAPGSSTIRDNVDHFVKRGRIGVLSRAGAAIALATLQTSAPSGGAGHRTSLRGGGPLTTLALPGTHDKSEPTLWQRLWANVPGDLRAEPDDYRRVFPWLVPTRISDGTGEATTPDHVHLAQAFFGMPRRIRLVFEPNIQQQLCDLLREVDDVIVTGYIMRPRGTNYEAWSLGHPLSPYYKPKKDAVEFLPLHLQSSRVGYREYLGMAMRTKDGQRVPARGISDFEARAENFEGDEKSALRGCRLLAAGYAMDNMKPLDFGEALMPLIITGSPHCDEAIADIVRAFVTAANMVAGQLSSAVKRALYGPNRETKRDNTVLTAVRDSFWADTEQAFYTALRASADELDSAGEALTDRLGSIQQKQSESWRKLLRKLALAIFDDTVTIDDAESDRIKDVIVGRKMLVLTLEGYGTVGKKVFGALNIPLPKTKSKKGSKVA